jgi:hypothetical protein
VRYQANQEKNDEDEEADSGNLSCGKRHNSKTEEARYQGDYEEHQRVIQHGKRLLFCSEGFYAIDSASCNSWASVQVSKSRVSWYFTCK